METMTLTLYPPYLKMETPPHPLGKDPVLGREIYLLPLSQLNAMPDTLHLPSPHFAALLVADTASLNVETLSNFCRKLIDSGCAYFSAWGPGCERIHDVFDELHVITTLDNPTASTLMTTWHSDQSLDETLDFFLSHTLPDPAYSTTCNTSLLLPVAEFVKIPKLNSRDAEKR